MGKVKVISRALKITKQMEVVEYLLINFSELNIFAREMTLLMQVLHAENPDCFGPLATDVINSILSPPASSVQLIKIRTVA